MNQKEYIYGKNLNERTKYDRKYDRYMMRNLTIVYYLEDMLVNDIVEVQPEQVKIIRSAITQLLK